MRMLHLFTFDKLCSCTNLWGKQQAADEHYCLLANQRHLFPICFGISSHCIKPLNLLELKSFQTEAINSLENGPYYQKDLIKPCYLQCYQLYIHVFSLSQFSLLTLIIEQNRMRLWLRTLKEVFDDLGWPHAGNKWKVRNLPVIPVCPTGAMNVCKELHDNPFSNYWATLLFCHKCQPHVATVHKRMARVIRLCPAGTMNDFCIKQGLLRNFTSDRSRWWATTIALLWATLLHQGLRPDATAAFI